jgi:putative spermidine/putrescine transport system substrate-binding protein
MTRLAKALSAVASLSFATAALANPTPIAAAQVGKAALKGSFTVYSDDDVNIQHLWVDTLIPDFQQQYPGIKINYTDVPHGTEDATVLAKLAAAQSAGKYSGFDLIGGADAAEAAVSGLLTPITTSEVPLAREIPPTEFVTVDHNALPYRGSKVLIAYNSAKVPAPPKTLPALLAWIKSHPGQFDYNNPTGGGSGQAFIEAVLNQYVPPADQKKMALGYVPGLEGLWDKGFSQLKSLGPDIYQRGVYPASQDQVYQLLGAGSIEMCPVWSDQGLSALKDHEFPPTVKLMELSPPLFGGPAYLGVPKITPHKSLVFAFLNFLLSTPEQVKIVNQVQGLPGISFSYMPKGLQKQFAFLGTTESLPYSAKMAADLNRLWESQVA